MTLKDRLPNKVEIIGSRDEYARGFNEAIQACFEVFDQLEKEAVKVYGYRSSEGAHGFSSEAGNQDMHVGLLIDIQSIKRGVSKKDIKEVIEENGCDPSLERCNTRSTELLLRIAREGMLND